MCRPNWKHGLALYHPPCYLRAIDFPAASVMYHWRAVHRWIPSLFWKPHSSVEKHILLDKKIFKKANRVKWIEAKQLSFIYFLFCYYSLIYFILYYFIFSPSTFSSMHVRTMRTGSYAPAKVLFIKITSVLMSNLIYWLFALHSAKALDITQLIRKLRRGLRRPAFHFWLSNSERGVGSSNFRLST